MKGKVKRVSVISCIILILFSGSCRTFKGKSSGSEAIQVIFLHHSTGQVILNGGSSTTRNKFGLGNGVASLIRRHNKEHQTRYRFHERSFPGDRPYGWNNYPFDYYNIWVDHAGEKPYQKEPTLELLTDKYQVVVFKHCFPVSHMVPADSLPNIRSEVKSTENYKLQYLALREKLRQFPGTKFLLWTGPALVKGNTNPEEAALAHEFFTWVVREWDEPGDNIYLWDFRALETDGGPYLLDKNAAAPDNSHPGPEFASKVAPLFVKRLIDVIENRGDTGSITGV